MEEEEGKEGESQKKFSWLNENEILLEILLFEMKKGLCLWVS